MKNLLLGLADCGNKPYTDIHAGDKPCTETSSDWWETLHWDFWWWETSCIITCSWCWQMLHRDLLMLVISFILWHSWWETLHWDLIMLKRNLSLVLINAGEKPYIEAFAPGKPYTETYTWWWKTLNRDLLIVYKPYTETFSCWWETLQLNLLLVARNLNIKICTLWWQNLHWDLLMLVRNLILRFAHCGDKTYTGTCFCWWETLY